jgi:hypothetical protein
MKAWGKCERSEARRPWVTSLKFGAALKGRNTCHISAFQALLVLWLLQPGATRFALAPGFHIPRLRRSASTFEAKLVSG